VGPAGDIIEWLLLINTAMIELSTSRAAKPPRDGRWVLFTVQRDWHWPDQVHDASLHQ